MIISIMPSHGANTIIAADKIARNLARSGYDVKVSKPRGGKTKYRVITEGRKKNTSGRIRATFKSSVI